MGFSLGEHESRYILYIQSLTIRRDHLAGNFDFGYADNVGHKQISWICVKCCQELLSSLLLLLLLLLLSK